MRIAAAALLLLVVAAPAPARADAGLKHAVLTIAQRGQRYRLTVEVADTGPTRSRGLMYRTTLPEDAGMLFVFEEQSVYPFWMKNTLIPLSIAWIDSGRVIVEIQDMEVVPAGAAETPIYTPAHAAKYALEVNKGYFAKRGITAGARVTIGPAK